LRVSLNLAPYSSVDLHAYDLLIESMETYVYTKEWREHCERLECPILLKAMLDPLALGLGSARVPREDTRLPRASRDARSRTGLGARPGIET
jgi:hypothetical protein